MFLGCTLQALGHSPSDMDSDLVCTAAPFTTLLFLPLPQGLLLVADFQCHREHVFRADQFVVLTAKY